MTNEQNRALRNLKKAADGARQLKISDEQIIEAVKKDKKDSTDPSIAGGERALRDAEQPPRGLVGSTAKKVNL